MERLQKLDSLNLIEYLPLSNLPNFSHLQLPPADQLRRQIHLVLPDNSVLAGADAISAALSLLPRSRQLGRLLQLPGIRSLARPVYRWIARHRLALSRLVADPHPHQK